MKFKKLLIDTLLQYQKSCQQLSKIPFPIKYTMLRKYWKWTIRWKFSLIEHKAYKFENTPPVALNRTYNFRLTSFSKEPQEKIKEKLNFPKWIMFQDSA